MQGVHIEYVVNSLSMAVHRGDWKMMVKQLADPSKHDKADMSRALTDCAERGLEECVRVLLQAGTPVNIHDASGFTPLIVAAKKGHSEIVKLLLKPDYNVRVNKATFHIRATALHWAATNGRSDCVRLLLEEGANPSLTTIHGRTPLMLAARSNEEEILLLLLEKGGSVNARDFEGATALHLAAEEGADSCCRALLRAGAEINAQMNNGYTPLICAARKGQDEVLQMLLHKATTNLEKRGHHLTVLHWAAIGGSAECVDALLYRGVPPDVRTLESYYGGDLIVNAGVTPVMLAAEHGHSEVIETLVEHNAKVDDYDEEGNTALLYAIRKQRKDCVKVLLAQGADPDGVAMTIADEDFETEERGLSPIFLALKQNNSAIVKLLLQANCNLKLLGCLRDDIYVTPLEFAISKQKFHLARMLLAAGCGTDIAGQGLVEEGLAWLLSKNESEFVRFAELFHTPPTLFQITRNRIRQIIGKRIQKAIHQLPLPVVLRNYVNLDDLEDL